MLSLWGRADPACLASRQAKCGVKRIKHWVLGRKRCKLAGYPRRPDARRTRVWYGPIGSGEKLMKNAQKRNELRDRYNVIGLEMEAAQ